MGTVRDTFVILALVAGATIAAQPASGAQTQEDPDTSRAYAACVVTDQAGKTLYATAPGRIDVLTQPASLDVQAYSAWISRVYSVPELV